MELLWILAYVFMGAVSYGLSARAWGYPSDDEFAFVFFGAVWPIGIVISVMCLFGWCMWRMVEFLSGWD